VFIILKNLCVCVCINRYRWTKDGEDFDVTARVDRITQKAEAGKLTFLKPSDDDEGEYLCFAENGDGTARSNLITVKKVFLESFVNESVTREMEAVEGDPFTLECLAPNGVPKPNIFWMIQTTQGAIKSVDNPRVTLGPATGNLWFSSVSREDASKDAYYVCSAASSVANEYKLGNRIALKVIPRIAKLQKGLPPTLQYVSPPSVFALRNTTVEIFCIYGGSPVPKVTWSKDGEAIEYNERIISENYGKSVKIKKADVEDGGNYTCDVANENGESVSSNFNVEVIYPPTFTIEPESRNVTANEPLEIECEADGNPQPMVQWYFNGNPIEADGPERELRKNKIVIKAVQKAHKGNYACYATNNASYIFKDIYVNVLDSS
jgi:neuronal cell adhesion molecule